MVDLGGGVGGGGVVLHLVSLAERNVSSSLTTTFLGVLHSLPVRHSVLSPLMSPFPSSALPPSALPPLLPLLPPPRLLLPAIAAFRGLSGGPVDTIEPIEVIQTAQSVYTGHPSAFHQFPLNNLEFKVGQHFVTGEPYPHLYVGEEVRSGIMHVTPWSAVNYATFGEKGTLGTQQR
jgi:hypothetical protein